MIIISVDGKERFQQNWSILVFDKLIIMGDFILYFGDDVEMWRKVIRIYINVE